MSSSATALPACHLSALISSAPHVDVHAAAVSFVCGRLAQTDGLLHGLWWKFNSRWARRSHNAKLGYHSTAGSATVRLRSPTDHLLVARTPCLIRAHRGLVTTHTGGDVTVISRGRASSARGADVDAYKRGQRAIDLPLFKRRKAVQIEIVFLHSACGCSKRRRAAI